MHRFRLEFSHENRYSILFEHYMRLKKYLVLYSQAELITRRSIKEHSCFIEKIDSEKVQVFYLNTFFQNNYFDLSSFDCIILTTSFLSSKWSSGSFKRAKSRIKNLNHYNGLIVALPQDEFINTALLDSYFESLTNLHVMTILPEHEWSKIYPRSIKKGHTFEQALTGYINHPPKKKQLDFFKRAYEISYRAWATEPWLGKHSYKKYEIYKKFAKIQKPSWNISTNQKDMLTGRSWDKLLQNSKFVIGTEQGASISDPKGILREQYLIYKVDNPNSDWIKSYDDCNFAIYENSIDLRGLSPRIFEAMQNNAALILLEGDYNGVLKSNKHYIPLKKDYSNLDEIVSNLDAETHKRIIESYIEIFNNKELWYSHLAGLINSKVEKKSNILRKRYLFLYQIFKFKNVFLQLTYSAAVKLIGSERLIRIVNAFK
jgi:hypothetical protein